MINIIKACTNRTITGEFKSIKEVVEFIKSPNKEHLELIQKARALDRKSKEYTDIKINKLPAITINFNFTNRYVTGKNVSESTGYLYIDVDGLTEEDLEINTTYVCAYWRSLSNQGITIIVKTEGLTADNFKEATEEIAKLLDIPYDSQAVSIDRLTALSYDPNAYYNDNVEVFPIDEMISEDSQQNHTSLEKSTHYNTIKYNNIGYDCNGYKLRFNNLDELLESYKIVYDENGFYDFGRENKLRYAQVFVPFRKIVKGERESILKSIAYQLVALNKSANRMVVFKYLCSINSARMLPPLEHDEVAKTLAKIYKNLNKVSPHMNATRRFIYDKNKNLSTKEKRALNMKQIGKDKQLRSKSELLTIMRSWNHDLLGKMTIEKLAIAAVKNRKTVQKYYKELKRIIWLSELLLSKKEMMQPVIHKCGRPKKSFYNKYSMLLDRYR
ncbi:BT4734/BF3469 family protein [Chryseobacterium indologenes]|uniref:BT4734/BF3469 family protein n=1 Tax=Chryseobacterium indologenes TaxID=253 RepID=UPI00162A3C59|nr:BT4734/BF3469 family protein [Chryseobacterium indologenes]